jgi:hypothetical protein
MKLDQKGLTYTEKYIEEMTPDQLQAADVKGIPTMFVDDVKMTNLRKMTDWTREVEVTNG